MTNRDTDRGESPKGRSPWRVGVSPINAPNREAKEQSQCR